MIYYFTGTGNSRWLAQRLAEKTGDKVLNIIGLQEIPPMDAQTVGIVFPIYAWGVPEPVTAFVKHLRGKPAYTFAVCTCGDEAGNAMDELHAIFPLDSAWSVAMPSNYVMGADVESNESISAKISNAREKMDEIAEHIRNRQSVHDVNKGKMPWVKSTLFNFGFNKAARSTKPFYVTQACNSCGLCARNCPAKTITMVDGKPQWNKKCYQCTACINLCPTRAIQYRKATEKRGRYRLSDHVGTEGE